MRALAIALLLISTGCQKWVESAKPAAALGNLSNSPQVTSAKLQSGQLVLTGSSLDVVSEANVSTTTQSVTLAILSKTATNLVLAANSPMALKQASILTLQTAIASTPFNLTVDLAGTTVSNFSSTGIRDLATATMLTIAGSGNIGIATTTPSSSLTINGSLAARINAVAANYTLTNTDNTILANAAAGIFTLTLPTAAGISGRQYNLKKVDALPNAITISPINGETIDGGTGYTLSLPNQYVTIISNGSNWSIINATNALTGCPSGMKLMGRGRSTYCVENAARSAQNYMAASTICRNQGYELCSFHQWASACDDGGSFTFTGAGEWVAEPYSSGSGSRAVLAGTGSCSGNDANYGYMTNPNPFRCCVR